MDPVRRAFTNSLAQRGITFAMIELSNPQDCNDRKRGWKRLGFKDVSPKWGPKSHVLSLNERVVLTQGKDALEAMKGVVAHWYVLSGHHGRLYGADGGSLADVADHFNHHDFAGFFNNHYHHGRWNHANRSEPDRGKNDRRTKKQFQYELYLRTTAAAPVAIAPFSQDNPLADGSPTHTAAKQARCLGVILSACNTLNYKSVRIFWHSLFPKAVFFGTFRTIGSGVWVTNAIKRAKMTSKKFWKNPQEVLNGPDQPLELARQVAAKFPKSRRHYGLGLMYEGLVYLPTYEGGKLEIQVYSHDEDLPF